MEGGYFGSLFYYQGFLTRDLNMAESMVRALTEAMSGGATGFEDLIYRFQYLRWWVRRQLFQLDFTGDYGTQVEERERARRRIKRMMRRGG